VDTPSEAAIEEAIGEVELALDLLFEVADHREIDIIIKATSHAARGRILLEKVLSSR
jgi:hypothetical protein